MKRLVTGSRIDSADSSGRRNGQAMLEYAIALVVVVALTGLLALLLHTVRQSSNRVLDLVASEYP